ncbi:MAG: right-handed parallel beta-helix repeat-containing protein [Anaerolineae bacterium]|nr:right-handed parallel beta-helix repeat-containing protein [Anaerolineae bacterium]
MQKLCLVISLVGLLVSGLAITPILPGQAQANTATYYVAPNGVYANPGTVAEPTTFEGARDKIRALETLPAGGVTVYLRGGTYAITQTFTLRVQDSGVITTPIAYRAYKGETPILSGGASLDPAWFSQVTSGSPVWGRLDPAAQGNLWQVRLPDHGIDDYGDLLWRGFGSSNLSALELAFNDELMELARWPNRGQTDPFDEEAPAIVTGTLSPDVTGTYAYIGATAGGSADDGFPNYRRVGLVDGQQYYLYHCTWIYQDTNPKYWFISTHDPVNDPNCWPSSGPAWLAQGNDPHSIPLLEEWTGTSGDANARTQPEDYAADGFLRIPQVFSDTSFRLPGERYRRWTQADDIWFQGLFYYYWADDTTDGTIDDAGVVTLTGKTSYSGIKVKQPFAVLNLLEEIDTPGEWYLDRTDGTLYFWPPANLNGSRMAVSLLEAPLLDLNGAGHVHFEGITFELGREDLAKVQNADGVRFAHCTFRNTGRNAVNIVNSTNSGLEYALIYNTGAGGVLLGGGSRPSLTLANNYVRNSEIHHFSRWDRTYHPGIKMGGAGQIVEHNEIHHAPHTAILFTGNEHQIRYNEIGYVVQEANDAGAIYTGRDWGYRGNDIEYNFIHHIESVFGGSHGVYLDDAVSGMRVFGNVFYRIRGRATFTGGGRDNLVENNIVVGAQSAHLTDRRAQVWSTTEIRSDGCPGTWNLLGRINTVFETCYSGHQETIDYQHGIWATSYPSLTVIPNDWSLIADSHWLNPEGSTFTCNSVWDVETVIFEASLGGTGALDWYAKYDNNLEADPLFVDEANLDLALLPDSPVYSQLPCFDPIPFEQIGVMPEPVRLYLPLVIRG